MLSCLSLQNSLCLSHACGKKYQNNQNTKCQKQDYQDMFEPPIPKEPTQKIQTHQAPCPRSGRDKNTKRTKIENTRIPGSNRNKKQQKGENTRLLVQDVLVVEDCIGRPHHLGGYLSSLYEGWVRTSSDDLFLSSNTS